MFFGGMIPVTLINYPGIPACAIFTTLCNFSCPFCHNFKTLVKGELQQEDYSEKEVLLYLKKRRNLIDGVVISGGEPCLDLGLPEFVEQVKELGLKVKIDTNGSKPEMLKRLIDDGLVDYIAMDIKNSFDKYQITAGLMSPSEVSSAVEGVKKSISIIMDSGIDYEFRTTVVDGFHTEEDMHKIGSEIYGAKRYYIQQFKLTPEVKDQSLKPLSYMTMMSFKKIMEEYVKEAKVKLA